MSVIWRKVWFDLWHNKTRTFLAVLSIAAGVFAVGAIFGMSDLLITNMDISQQSVIPPHIDVSLAGLVNKETILNIRSVPGVEDVEPYNEVSVQYKLHPQDPWRQGVIEMKGDYIHQKFELVQLRQGQWPKKNEIGMSTGLAWTEAGGEILFIEVAIMHGKGSLIMTGQLGDVMKESAKISLSLVRSRLASTANSFDFTSSDIHIHVPSGATPKDGPSAGITLFTALASLISGKTVDPKVAMTGEITLSGAVLPVGGIKEKVLAAHRAGIKKVILPKENERDLEDVPEDVRSELQFVPVETIEEVLKEALDIDLPRPFVSYPGNSFAPAKNL